MFNFFKKKEITIKNIVVFYFSFPGNEQEQKKKLQESVKNAGVPPAGTIYHFINQRDPGAVRVEVHHLK